MFGGVVMKILNKIKSLLKLKSFYAGLVLLLGTGGVYLDPVLVQELGQFLLLFLEA